MTPEQAPRLSVVAAEPTPAPAEAFATTIGVRSAECPEWIARVLDDQAITWLTERWDGESGVFEFLSSDRLTMHESVSNCRVPVAGMRPPALLEMFACVWMDRLTGVRNRPSDMRSIARACINGDARSLVHIEPNDLAQVPGVVLRRWQTSMDLASADPDREWERDYVRLRVVKPGSGNHLLRFGDITQPWLRELVLNVVRTNMTSTSDGTLTRYVLAGIRISTYLSTRPDHGMNPAMLSSGAMDRFVAWMRRESGNNYASALREVSSVLSNARVLGLADRYGLPAAFVPRDEHWPQRPQADRGGEKGYPEATFRFLMGSDDMLGHRVLEIAKSVPGDPFMGDQFVVALQLAANFGRRPEELLSLTADRLRHADNGRAELLYDNFKSGRNHVWLPVDARAAELVDGWVDRLRLRYPDTPLSELRLFPRPNRNPEGTRPLAVGSFSWWFRVWTCLLEEAIVVGRLATTTGISVEDLCALVAGDADGRGITVRGHRIELSPTDGQMVVDYKNGLLRRLGERKYAPPDLDQLPLFPDPFSRTGGNPRTRRVAFIAISPSRFDALGERSEWIQNASLYTSSGIPGTSLGIRRIEVSECSPRLFRHTYLQHLADLGTDIFLVQELADHTHVNTTIESYVRVREDKLREAADRLAEYRFDRFGRKLDSGLNLLSAPMRDVGTNDCRNPKVLNLGKEGCDYDRLCFDCVHVAADPSNIPDIRSEIHTCNMTLARIEAEARQGPAVDAHVTMLRLRRDGWREMLRTLEGHMNALGPAERERVDTAVKVVRDFRNRVRSGGVNFGGPGAERTV